MCTAWRATSKQQHPNSTSAAGSISAVDWLPTGARHHLKHGSLGRHLLLGHVAGVQQAALFLQQMQGQPSEGKENNMTSSHISLGVSKAARQVAHFCCACSDRALLFLLFLGCCSPNLSSSPSSSGIDLPGCPARRPRCLD